jgi:hypothetical protein
MTETEAFGLCAPVEENLVAIERAWQDGTARYRTRTDDIWYRTLRAPAPELACEYAVSSYPARNPGRFTPIFDSSGIVPAAYAASTRAVSLWEVILRRIRHDGIRRVATSDVHGRYLVSVAYTHPLSLFDIRRPRDLCLVAPGQRPPALSAAGPSGYPITCQWAQSIHDRLPGIDGIIYESHQIAGQCVVLFQRSTQRPPLFRVIAEPQSLLDPPARTLLIREAIKANIAIDFGALSDEDRVSCHTSDSYRATPTIA